MISKITGLPIIRVNIDLEKGNPTRHYKDKFITRRMFSADVLVSINLPVGIYGTGKYGACKYGANFGIYGTSIYGDSSYA